MMKTAGRLNVGTGDPVWFLLSTCLILLGGCGDPPPDRPTAQAPSSLTNNPTPAERAKAPGGAAPFDWRKDVETEDYRAYVANLRKIHMPEATIRDLVIMDLKAAYETRLRDRLKAAGVPEDYWDYTDAKDKASGSPYQIRKEMEAEKQAMLTALLGLDEAEAKEAARIRIGENIHKLAAVPAYVSEENADKFRRLNQRMTQTKKQLQLRAKETGMKRTELRKHQASLDTQFERQLARTMGTEEVWQHMLRHSFLAEEIRNRLIAFQPTEQEFKDIYVMLRERPELELTAYSLGGEAEGMPAQELQAELEARLGDQRFAELRQAMSPELRLAQRLQRNQGLSESTARAAAEVTTRHWAALEAVRSEAGLSEIDRQRRIESLKIAHEARLVELGAANKRQQKRLRERAAKQRED